MKPLDLEGRQSPSLVSGPLRLTRGLPLILTKFVPPRSSIQLLERPPAASASQSRSAVPAGRRLRRRWIWQNHAVGAMASADGRPGRTYRLAEPR